MVFLLEKKTSIYNLEWTQIVISWTAMLMVVLKSTATAYSAGSKSGSEDFKNRESKDAPLVKISY
jgi:hypothetical protein